MPLSGEAIRMMNYVDDVSTTMRRLLATAPLLTAEERKRVSEYLKGSTPNAVEVLAVLESKPTELRQSAILAGIRSAAVIGAGAQGARLAAICRSAGCVTTLEDVLPSKLRRATAELADEILEDAAMGKLLTATSVDAAVRDVDIVLDTMPDELESKLEIFTMVDRMAPPRTILLTPTETHSIADLASCTYRSERCFAFVMPGRAPARVRVMRTAGSDAAALDAVLDLWRRAGYEPEVLTDPGDPPPPTRR